MTRLCLLTSVDSSEPMKWGLEIDRIAVPIVLLCSAGMEDELRQHSPAHALIVPTELPETLAPQDKLARLYEACKAECHGADQYYWLDIEFVYRHLSFEFLYSNILTRAVKRLAAGPVHFGMPGYHASCFFGGPKRALEAVYEQLDGAAANLFEGIPTASAPGPAFPSAFGNVEDLNLKLAAVIQEPILHVVGDSHVLNCFTLNTAIGCRPNILMRTGDVSQVAIPYAYQFSHHLGGRTMHHAGRPGALLAAAKECGVKDGDAVVWVFGEIDVRSHIVRQQEDGNRPLDEVIDTLARDYIRGVREVASAYAGVRSVVFGPIPPLDNPGYTSAELPVHGTIEERIAATRKLCAALEARCAPHDISFLDVSAPFATARGDLRWELSDHFCHIASSYQGPIVEALYNLLARQRGGGASTAGPGLRPPPSA